MAGINDTGWTNSAQTLAYLLERNQRRRFAPLSRAFVQRRAKPAGPGPLAAFVGARREHALDLYLLLHAVASAPPWDVSEYLPVWARALGISTPRSAGPVVSEN